MTAVVPFGFPAHTAKPPCQWGPCGHCDAGRHDRCGAVTHPSTSTRPSPHTWILDKHGRVVLPHTAVYQPGYREHWICACHAAGHAGAGSQDALFEVTA